MMKERLIADAYVERYKRSIVDTYKPKYHVTPPVGWLNDPNGFSRFQGKYHLFYQYHPYSSAWGPMHWAHVTSRDFIHWEWCPVALAPECDYELDGCFSGTAIEHKKEHVLIYTSHLHPDLNDRSLRIQQQCIARSKDGIGYIKDPLNPVIKSSDLPDTIDPNDFRDPKIFEKDGKLYCLIATRGMDGSGQLVLFDGRDVDNWEYKGILCASKNTIGEMWECPDIFELNGQDMIIVSPMLLEERGYEFHNIHSAIYMNGRLDLERPEFFIDSFSELDCGLDFYAPQTLESADGRRIMIGWMHNWGRTCPSHEMGHFWAGTMTLPRELSLENNQLLQNPIRELKGCRNNEVKAVDLDILGDRVIDGLEGSCIEIELDILVEETSDLSLRVFEAEDEYVSIEYNANKETLAFDRSHLKTVITGLEDHDVSRREIPLQGLNGKVHLNIFLDISTVEIFVNHGRKVMSNTVYPLRSGKGIRLMSKDGGKIASLKKWDLNI